MLEKFTKGEITANFPKDNLDLDRQRKKGALQGEGIVWKGPGTAVSLVYLGTIR